MTYRNSIKRSSKGELNGRIIFVLILVEPQNISKTDIVANLLICPTHAQFGAVEVL
jgi:hypothetical protein